MRIRVPNHSVKKNLETFNFLLQRERKPEVPKKKKRTVFYASVDRESGEILFQDFMPGCEVISNKEWKPVCLRLCDSIGENGERKFEILEMGKEGKPFVGNDLRPRARDIVDLTMKALNELLLQTRRSLDPEFFLDQLLEFELQDGETVVDTNILRSAWHPVSRVEAEKMLDGRLPGVFLFRKDEYAALLEEGLKCPCITLTYTNGKKQIVDCTLVHYGDSWLVYDGDPNLKPSPHKSVVALIVSLGNQLSLPFFR